ncbi:MAG TPA: RNA polymerase sigma factor [Planctomycetota bacterium]|nr:RNA polymerase sigma factor [Planctomycetota bacterium]
MDPMVTERPVTDSALFERLYRETSPTVHSLARRILGARHADEATQEAYLRVWRALPGFRGDGSAHGWVRRVALTVVLNRRRALLRLGERIESGETAAQEAPAKSCDETLRVDLDDALAELPDGARTVFVLHDVEGHDHAEIAELLSVAVGTSKSQLHRARMLLRARLADGREDRHA